MSAENLTSNGQSHLVRNQLCVKHRMEPIEQINLTAPNLFDFKFQISTKQSLPKIKKNKSSKIRFKLLIVSSIIATNRMVNVQSNTERKKRNTYRNGCSQGVDFIV